MDNYALARHNFELAITHRLQARQDASFSAKAMFLYRESIRCLLKHLLDIDAVEYDQSENITSLASRLTPLFDQKFYQQICSVDSIVIGEYLYDDYQMGVLEGYEETLKFIVDNKLLKDGGEYERLDWKDIKKKYRFQFLGLVNVVYNEKHDIVSGVVKYVNNTEIAMKARQIMEPTLVTVSVR